MLNGKEQHPVTHDSPSVSASFLQQNLRYLRKRLEMSQEQLAEKIGLNRGNIASYENASAEPKICNLLRLSNFFGVSILDITQSDLSEDSALEKAIQAHANPYNSERETILAFMKRSDEIQEVFESIHKCHEFKIKSVETLPQDMKFLLQHFEQLYDAAQTLLRQHQALLEFMKCK
ncbi:MAG: helix-turn-helix transcriptional regulator [Saprospiraceae bacterium]|nr:helix-turn-helix transcriptional regulator [Saprospiraceae bacterium]